MINFIPLENYYDFLIYMLMFLVFTIIAHAYTLKLDDDKNIKFLRTFGYIVLVVFTLYLGLRPISGRAFGDMATYSHHFKYYALGNPIVINKDYLFHYYIKLTSNFVSVYGFFLITEFLYIYPMYLISKIHFKKYWFYAFFMFIASFSFYTYGVNGIRNGVATSFFLWGLCYNNNKKLMVLFFTLAALSHKTLLLPIMAYVLTMFYNNPKTYMKAWLLAIPMSLLAGSIWISLFTSLGFGDDRLAGYLTAEVDKEAFSSTGFRWDFLFYSSFAVFTGWYFIVKKKFEDTFYNKIYATYLICNAFWILVIRANFSNRFAYLSWFLMAIIIIYPFLKQRFFNNQEIIIAKVVAAYSGFTFLMWFVYDN